MVFWTYSYEKITFYKTFLEENWLTVRIIHISGWAPMSVDLLTSGLLDVRVDQGSIKGFAQKA